MSQLACFEKVSPEPILLPEGHGQAQSKQDDIRAEDERRKGKKKVRFKNWPLKQNRLGQVAQRRMLNYLSLAGTFTTRTHMNLENSLSGWEDKYGQSRRDIEGSKMARELLDIDGSRKKEMENN